MAVKIGGSTVINNSTDGLFRYVYGDGRFLTNLPDSGGGALGWISFTGTGSLINSKNMSLSRFGVGYYRINLSGSARTSDYTAVFSMSGPVRYTKAAPTGSLIGTDGQIDNHSISVGGRSSMAITFYTNKVFNDYQHFGGNDNNTSMTFRYDAVDPPYISCVTYKT